ncbi:MAG: tRNA (adenosine(37)-N6)-threonylcarbamoyltransferase complex ATPase subunit type 1 TsaE [Acholeplasmataceae bacterium]|nr:tRNA (adenosine(37)-N6)-threonylcarbamoyltransferase complex ATPase subunit type 1 TsaE [Acholeplasmataceae bacterium]
MKTKRTNSPEETKHLGFELGLLLKDEEHVVLLLDGELGSGKTTLAQGIAQGFGITDIVNSPSYTILKKYQTPVDRRGFYHLDLYRLSSIGDDFDLEEYIDGNGLVVIEWPFQVEELLPKDYMLIKIKKSGVSEREFEITCVGFPCQRAVSYI